MPYDTTLPSLVRLLELAIEQASAAARRLRYDLDDPTLGCSVALLLTVIDLGRSAVAMNRGSALAALPMATRSALDAYVDICNLRGNPTYWENLDAADSNEWRKVCQTASAGRNLHLAELAKATFFLEGRRYQSDRYKELVRRGVTKLDAEERFTSAGLTTEYEASYQMLSAETHNNVSFLRSRYFHMNSEGRLTLTDVPGHNLDRACTLNMAELVVRSAEHLLALCGHGTAAVGEASRAIGEVWELAQKEDSHIGD